MFPVQSAIRALEQTAAVRGDEHLIAVVRVDGDRVRAATLLDAGLSFEQLPEGDEVVLRERMDRNQKCDEHPCSGGNLREFHVVLLRFQMESGKRRKKRPG